MFFLRSVVLSMLALLGATLVSANPIQWKTPVVIPEDPTHGMELKGGPDGLFHMILCQDSTHSFSYGRLEETGFYMQLIESYATSGTMYCALNFWGNMPVAGMRYEAEQNMAYSIRTGAWTSPSEIPQTLDSHRIKLAVENTGVMHVAFVQEDDAGGSHLMYSYTDGPDWELEHVFLLSDHSLVTRIDMELDSTNTPHFAWFDANFNYIGYAVRTGFAEFDADIAAQGVDACRWIDLELMAPDIPVIGFLQGSSTESATLHYTFKFGSSFYEDEILGNVGITSADMAVPREDTITTSRLYFFAALPTGIHTLRPVVGGWDMSRIAALYDVSSNVLLDADWNSASNSVGLLISDFTEDELYFIEGTSVTPTPTAQPPTPTPGPCDQLGCDVTMPSTSFHPGDLCNCLVTICNPGPKTYINVPLFVILDVYGEYFFAPSFTDLDHYTYDSIAPGTHLRTVIPDFSWPEGVGSASGLLFYAGMTNAEMTELLGEYDSFTFGYSD